MKTGGAYTDNGASGTQSWKIHAACNFEVILMQRVIIAGKRFSRQKFVALGRDLEEPCSVSRSEGWKEGRSAEPHVHC